MLTSSLARNRTATFVFCRGMIASYAKKAVPGSQSEAKFFVGAAATRGAQGDGPNGPYLQPATHTQCVAGG